jgi:hypothetical protein
MAKKKKFRWKSLSSTVRTCIIFALVFMVVGLGLFIYGALFYKGNVKSGDLKQAPAKLTSITERKRNLSEKEKEDERKKGIKEANIENILDVEYTYTVDGKEHVYKTTHPYDSLDSIKVGDSGYLTYAVVDGEIVINPESDMKYVICGVIVLALGMVAALIGFYISPRKTKKKNADN